MHDLGYLLAGYGVTGATILGYRLQLSHRAHRARRLITAISGRPPAGTRARR